MMQATAAYFPTDLLDSRSHGQPPFESFLTSAIKELEGLASSTPKLHALLSRAVSDPETLAREIRSSPLAALASLFGNPTAVANSSYPIAVAHGMGDSCFNPGMKSITKFAGIALNTYSVCLPTADNLIMDTIKGFLHTMDASVDDFAKRVRADPKLANGFNAFGLSQGNNIIRGYIAKYNDPPVRSFLSICGINAGVAAFPHCSPKTPVVGIVCEVLTEVLGDLAYNPLVQSILFQANYFRDPTKTNSTPYLRHSELAKWNGETGEDMSAHKANWAKTQRFVWVMGTEDTMVWPREGEHWAAPTDKYPKDLSALPMKQTRWYTEDTFGLRTAEEAGKNFFETFKGEHIRFTEAELQQWLVKHFV